MKTVLGIIGSPRRLGNSEIMVKEISRQIPEPHRLRLLRLADFTIGPCRGCYACLFKEEQCIQKDDLAALQEAILAADALILAAPTYFLGINGALKQVVDRGLAFYTHIERLWGKPSVGVCIAGIHGKGENRPPVSPVRGRHLPFPGRQPGAVHAVQQRRRDPARSRRTVFFHREKRARHVFEPGRRRGPSAVATRDEGSFRRAEGRTQTGHHRLPEAG